MSDEELRDFHTIEFSLDFPTRSEQDTFRGEGNWDLVLDGLRRCRELGIRTSVIAVMMRTNWDRMAAIARVAAAHGAMFRLNVYQPVTTDAFTLSYEQYWDGFRLLFAETRLVACSEPLVNAIIGLGTTRGSPCGTTSIRISPRGEVTPCPYWPEHRSRSETWRSRAARSPTRRSSPVPAWCPTPAGAAASWRVAAAAVPAAGRYAAP